jgi:DNA-binding NarL/FixJ family response regulator
METIKVLIAVKSKALARVIQHVLHTEAGISGIDFADSEQRLMEQAQRLRPGLIIVNSRLLGRDAGVALTQLKRANPQSKLLLTCNFEESHGRSTRYCRCARLGRDSR